MFLKNEQMHLQQLSRGLSANILSKSLRPRLFLWYGLLVLLALSIFSVMVFMLGRNVLYKNVQDSLEANNRDARSTTYSTLNRVGTDRWIQQLNFPSIDTYKDPGIILGIYDTKGQILYSLPQKITLQSMQLTPHDVEALAMQKTPTEHSFDGTHVMLYVTAIQAPVSEGNEGIINTGPVIGNLVVAKSLNDIDKTFLILQYLLLLSGITALVVALLCSWIISVNVLRPLSEIVRTARSITSTSHGTHLGNLNQRVPRPYGHDEMALVVDTFNDMLSALESSSRAQRRFIADASHELRAPLTTIQGNLSFLEHHDAELPTEERHLMLSDAHEETLRLSRLVDELLLLAHADADGTRTSTLSLPEETTDEKKPLTIELDHVVLQLVRQLRGRMNQDKTKVQLQAGQIEPIRVSGNEETIRRILLILLDNALKYTSSYRTDGSGIIKVSILRNEKEVIIRVQDNGMGIAEDDLPHIFDRFYRADEARSRAGSGLGLSIAQTLVDQLDGQISAESELGRGSIFTVHLPVSS